VGTLLLSLFTAKADDQQLVETYLQNHGVNGAVVQPLTDDFVGRTFPNTSFFGVIFRQYPIAVQCPTTLGLKCGNVFFVRQGQVDFLATIDDLRFFFATNLGAAPAQNTQTDLASTWLRFSEELKQDMFYTFSPASISFTTRNDAILLRAQSTVTLGGDGTIDVLITLGSAGSFIGVLEKGAVHPGIRPICQATKLLDHDPIVRRMAEQDLLVMGRAAKSYLDQVRATAEPDLQEAIDRIWQRILSESR
jgi:hypothetical protein